MIIHKLILWVMIIFIVKVRYLNLVGQKAKIEECIYRESHRDRWSHIYVDIYTEIFPSSKLFLIGYQVSIIYGE